MGRNAPNGAKASSKAAAPQAPQIRNEKPEKPEQPEKPEAGALQLLVGVGGIYGSFLMWAYLQEKLTTTAHGPADAPVHFRYPVFLNTIQSSFAAIVGLVYLVASRPRGASIPPIIPSTSMILPLLTVAMTTALASPFGYASLAHIDYITYLLAKSCKLLPVMALQVTLFGKRYPGYKYLVVATVTAGVAVFTLHSGKARSSKAADDESRNATWGMILLAVNLLFDGLTNTTQDWIFRQFQPFSGPQMMCANNMMMTLVTGTYLVLSPWLVHTGIGEYLGMDLVGTAGELRAALDFMVQYPAVWKDVLGFAAFGAVGQVFICELARCGCVFFGIAN
jgi:UDP-galactose transporter B1